jgi:mannose-6-phosphate isomerase-like protein (cupin superfamily)
MARERAMGGVSAMDVDGYLASIPEDARAALRYAWGRSDMSGDDVVSAVVSIPEAARGLELPFEPRDLVTVNDAIVRIAAIDGEFSWHHHDEDELFLCWEGAFRIETQDGEPVELTAGDIYVVPRGIEHRSVAERRAVALMLERPETLQYGN